MTPQRVSKIISSLREKGYIREKLKYKKDSKEIEERQITPIVKNNDGYSQDDGEGIDNIDYSGSQNQQLPIGENDKDIINTKNIKDSSKNRDIPNLYKTNNYDNVNWSPYYANY